MPGFTPEASVGCVARSGVLDGFVHKLLGEVDNALGELFLLIRLERGRCVGFALQSCEADQLGVITLLRVQDVVERELPEGDEEGRPVSERNALDQSATRVDVGPTHPITRCTSGGRTLSAIEITSTSPGCHGCEGPGVSSTLGDAAASNEERNSPKLAFERRRQAQDSRACRRRPRSSRHLQSSSASMDLGCS
jgi:hypothetical protein